jgi:hypothetical protein
LRALHEGEKMIAISRRAKCPWPIDMERAKNYLREEAGMDFDHQPALVWPPDAVAAYRDDLHSPWQFRTRANIRQGKIDDMERSLRFKRTYDTVQIRAAYIWVFWCPGISGCFRGWWTYFKGVGRDGNYRGTGRKGDVGHFADQIMQMFPIEGQLYGLDYDDWMPQFARQYQRGSWCGKPQGKAVVLLGVRNGCVLKFLRKLEWPKGKL